MRASFSTACISGFSAIDAARSLIASGQIDEAIVLGIELANNTTLAGFAALELLSRSARLAYPVRNGIPILLENEARTLSDEEIEKLAALRPAL